MIATYILLVFCANVVLPATLEMNGPIFIQEPPHHVDFLNSTGTKVECSVRGNPVPTLQWTLADGSPVNDVPGIRTVSPKGYILFHPFEAKHYRQDVHATTYRCEATNSYGAIISRDVRVRAVVKQVYEVQVYDEYVIKGNSAVLKCHIPSFVTEYVVVTSWVQDMSTTFSTLDLDGRFSLMPTGELRIRDVNLSDSLKSYRCFTVHRLTDDSPKLSNTAGRLIVSEPSGSAQPRITDSQSVLYAKQGDRVVLPCTAQGFPLPVYRWYVRMGKDQLIPVATSSRTKMFSGSLVILSAQISDSGTYACIVNNSVGVEKVETSLYVTAPLSAFLQPQHQVVDIGKSTTFSCLITGVPVNSVTWLKDGVQLRFTEDRFRLLSRESLRIDSVKREDRGMYQCHVRSETDHVQGTSQLMLGDASPEISEGFTEEVVQPGTSLYLRCVANGNPTPEITWTVNKESIVTSGKLSVETRPNGEVVSELKFGSFNPEDGGMYTCTARNQIGQAKVEAIINVYGPPYIRSMPRSTIVAGNTMHVSCPVVGFPIDLITWEKDGMTLPVNHRQTVHRNGTLVVQHMQRASDSGRYSCVARNQQGNAARRDLEVMVMVPPVLTSFAFQDGLYEGAHARVTCGVTHGDLPISFVWRKDGLAIAGDLGVNVRDVDEYSSILTISSASTRHSGNYTCIASNMASSTNHTATLIVNVPPQWVLEPSDPEALVGESVIVHCQANGYPPPTTVWKKAVGESPGNYREIISIGANLKVHENGSLHIQSVEENDKGHYLCQATNGVGTGLSKLIFINIHISARFAVKFRNQTVVRGHSALLTCEATGDMPIIITWTVNKQKIYAVGKPRYKVQERKDGHGVTSELSIEYAERDDSALFTCEASNAYGKDETTTQLIVQEPPDAPRNVRIIDQGSRSIQLAWTPPYDGNGPIIKYIVQYKSGSDYSWNTSSQNVTISGLQSAMTLNELVPASAYNVRIIAINMVGSSQPSEPVTIATAEEAPSGPPRSVKVEPINSRSLRIIWEAPKRDERNGNILGYYVGYRQHDSTEAFAFHAIDVKPDHDIRDFELQLSNLQKYTKYSIVVQAFNRLGTGPKSEEVVMMTSEDVPEQPPLGIECSSLSSQSLHASWEPPPPTSINGILRGYKVVYTAVEDRVGIVNPETKITTSTKTILHGLSKHSNYSIQVLTFTNVGDGTKSSPIFCHTGEDVPEAPEDIKAVVMSSDAIMVAWKSPVKPNGVISRYTVYARSNLEASENTIKHIVPADGNNYFEATGLKTSRRYDFWVTASTSIGEGQSTRVVSESTGRKVPAKIYSFNNNVVIPWKTEVNLPCRAVGAPAPEREWWIRSEKIDGKHDSRARVVSDGALVIAEAANGDAGNYTCVVRNIYGRDEVFYNVTVLAPPSSPTLYLSSTHLNMIKLKWKIGSNRGSPILGYSLNYKREYGDWEEVVVDRTEDGYTLSNLWCGSRYQIYLSSFNRIGTGEPSAILSTKTKGFAPVIPNKDELIQENSTSVLLSLDSWKSGGCQILYFVIEYKAYHKTAWTLVSNNVKPTHDRFTLQDLKPQTWYNLRVTAHNSAGSATGEYKFVTRTYSGGPVPPSMIRDQDSRPFVVDAKMIAVIVSSVLVVIVSLMVTCLCVRRHRRTDQQEKEEESNPAPSEPKLYPPANDHMSDRGNFTLFLGNSSSESVQRPYPSPDKIIQTELADDVCPYATFRIPGRSDSQHLAVTKSCILRNSGPTYAPSVRSGIYSKVQKSIALDVNSPITNSSICSPVKRDENFSPISESDLSEPAACGMDPFLQLQDHHRTDIPRLEHRVPDLLYHRPESSSAETSPDIETKVFHTRRQKSNVVVREATSDSPDSNIEDASYLYSHRLEHPITFSESREFSDAECDRDRHYQFLDEFKAKHCNGQLPRSNSPLLTRRTLGNLIQDFILIETQQMIIQSQCNYFR